MNDQTYDDFHLFFFDKKKYLSAESAKESEPNMTKSKCQVFVEEITQEFAHSIVRPPAMDQK